MGQQYLNCSIIKAIPNTIERLSTNKLMFLKLHTLIIPLLYKTNFSFASVLYKSLSNCLCNGIERRIKNGK